MSVLRVFLRRDRVEHELSAELMAYVELLTDEKVRAGMAPRAARRAALLELGGLEQVKERVRDAWVGAWLNALGRDVRHSLRLFARAPGFTAAVVISLGLGVGGTTAIFSVLNAVLLRPLPYPEAHELHLIRIWWDDFSASLSPADLGALREQDAIVSVGAYFFPGDGFALQHPEGPEVVQGAILTPDLPTVLGVQPLAGRTFTPDRDTREVLIAETFWHERFAGSADALGRTLELDGEVYTIVGVMPTGFGVPPQSDAMVWVKFEPQPPTRRGPFYLNTIARISADSNEPSAAARLTALSVPQLRDRFSVTEEWRYGLQPLKDAVMGDVRPTLRLLGWAVPLVLVIGILNFSNLLLARGLTRRHEIGVRSALGAARSRIAVQLLVESGLLGLMGGLAGLALAWIALRVAEVPAASIIPRMNEVQLDASVVMFALLVGLGAGLMAGVLPALRLPGRH
jgi:predicted permease